MNRRKPKIGFMVATSHNRTIDELGRPFPVMGMAEMALRALEREGCEAVLYKGKRIVDGEVKDIQVPNYNADVVIDNRRSAMEVAELFRREDVDAVVFFATSFLWANLYVQPLKIIGKPVLIWVGDRLEGCEAIGAWALKGALEVAGFKHVKTIYGTPDNPKVIREAMNFIEASRVKHQLSRSLFGRFGSMALGGLSALMDDADWIRKFGVTAEHLESLTLAAMAEKFGEKEIKEVYERIRKLTKTNYPCDQAMERNIRIYLAHRKLIEKYNLDFTVIKCFFELSENYVPPCIAQSLLLEEGFVASCTGDDLGALTMYIMRLFSDAPILQADVEQIVVDKKLVRLATCGAMQFSLIREKDKIPEEVIVKGPELERAVPSLSINAIAKAGPATCARIIKFSDGYKMLIAPGEIIEEDKDFRPDLGWPKIPAATVKLAGDASKFVENLLHQYIIVCQDDIADKLVELCKLLDIEPIIC